VEEIVIRSVKRVKPDEVVRLYKEAGWWKPGYDENSGFVSRIADRSFCFVGAFRQGEMIGMGRVLSDGVSDAYIQDVTVLKDFRGKGIGGRIIGELIRCCKAANVDWIGLFAEPRTSTFYKELGFCELDGYTPMVWHGK
jgi:spermidine synthase